MESHTVSHSARQSKNWFGLSNKVWGVVLLLLGSVFNAVDAALFNVALEEGVSTNMESLIGATVSLLGGLAVDAIFCAIGYKDGKAHWFVFTDIWKKDQRNAFLRLPYFTWWFLVFGLSNYFNTIFLLISYLFADNYADTVAIYDLYPVIIPLIGLCLRGRYPGFDWKNRYFLCFMIGIIGMFFLAQPGFIFGYHDGVNLEDQLFACILSLVAAFWAAIYVVANTIIETLSDSHTKQLVAFIPHPVEMQNIHNKNSPPNRLTIQLEAGDQPVPVSRANSDTDIVGPAILSSHVPIANEETPIIDGKMDFLSNEFIICNEWALVLVTIEYSSLITIIVCAMFSVLSVPEGSSFLEQFIVDFSGATQKGVTYTWLGGLVWILDYFFYTYGIFKLRNATLSGLLDTVDVFFSFLFAYLFLGEDADLYDVTGSMLIVATVVIALYPWERHECIPKWW